MVKIKILISHIIVIHFLTCKFFFFRKKIQDFIFSKLSSRFSSHFRRKSGDRKKLAVQMSGRFIVVFFSLSSFFLPVFFSAIVIRVDCWLDSRQGKMEPVQRRGEMKAQHWSPDRGCALSWNPRICSTWKIVKNHWKIHIVENKNGSPCANRGDCVDSCSLTKSTRIDYKTLHRSLISLIKSVDCVK